MRLPLPVAPEAAPLPEAYHEQHEAVRSREQAEDERAVAAERPAKLHELRSRANAGEVDPAQQLGPEEIQAEIAELRTQRENRVLWTWHAPHRCPPRRSSRLGGP